jgi:hypothetical protein
VQFAKNHLLKCYAIARFLEVQLPFAANPFEKPLPYHHINCTTKDAASRKEIHALTESSTPEIEQPPKIHRQNGLCKMRQAFRRISVNRVRFLKSSTISPWQVTDFWSNPERTVSQATNVCRIDWQSTMTQIGSSI